MDEDAVDGTDTADETMQWRRDASTSRTVRLLWAFGVGTFFAAIGTVVCWRLYRLGSEAAGGPGRTVVLAFIAAFAATVLALAASSHTEAHLARIAEVLPIDAPAGTSLNRAIDAAVGTVVMGAVIGALMGIGRYVSQNELLAAGAGPFTGLAALLIPGALIALVLASFLQSVGAFDREKETIYLYEPEQRIDLALVNAVSSRQIGDTAIVSLEYEQPDGQYVAGPRRIAVPPAIAVEIRAIVKTRRLRFSERVRRRLRGIGRRLRRLVGRRLRGIGRRLRRLIGR
ncbi:hypothetical protein [Natrinema pallidum]|uniref:Uncharacterized protein n=1 Tax=Natrinema pallidum TaxID=69527 RepID=A0A4P9TDM1_9EURY|nr:hypothetical protein [Natrinema pallidum]QCW01760.1 hypothetical protein FGF80_00190 [Natrinema pallidum]